MDEAGKKRRLDIQELEEIRNDAYENEAIYKEKTKAFHDKMISWKGIYYWWKCTIVSLSF